MIKKERSEDEEKTRNEGEDERIDYLIANTCHRTIKNFLENNAHYSLRRRRAEQGEKNWVIASLWQRFCTSC